MMDYAEDRTGRGELWHSSMFRFLLYDLAKFSDWDTRPNLELLVIFQLSILVQYQTSHNV